LSQALADETTPPWSQIQHLLREAWADPNTLWTRRTLGILRVLINRAVRQRSGA